MVDLASFQKMNPSYDMGFAESPCEVLRDNNVELEDITTDPTRMYAPAMVYGLSFRLKKWGTFRVCCFDDIVFNDSAFDALEMPAQKRAFAQNSEGCIILCYGASGTGKTFTAESISESLHAPLWSLSVCEPGITPQQLESYLVNVLDVPSTWSAILLLDEADMYLEKQSSFDLTRTAMIEIFLRNLDYHRGVLFFTTNRVFAFDEAFLSRISMILYYESKPADRWKIWESVLNRVNMNDIPEVSPANWSRQMINGREIRNVVHQAMILAKSNGQRLCANDIDQSLNKLVGSLVELADNCRAAGPFIPIR
uniref:ATPase AAA-type core domain-containing protein n=2 Tax=Physcomitrium patens TaxID=3218 RepID=A0A2K1J1M2_PHYPA|nr:hypothetical protein PHYPA_023328 [Physcomitrium patens]